METNEEELHQNEIKSSDTIGNVRVGYNKTIESIIFPYGVPFEKGVQYIIKTKHGLDVGEAISISCHSSASLQKKESDELSFHEDFFNIIRPASLRDLEQKQKQELQINHYSMVAKEKIKHFGLAINLIDTYPFFEGEKIIFTFYSEEKKVDFRSLVKELGSSLQMRIELHKIYSKDVSEILDGIGMCGKRFCCSTFKCHKNKKIMKPGKEGVSYHNTSLGICGKAKCCQNFE